MTNPLVSVVLPTYNRCSTLPRAIESVLNQTYENFELIIVDDASTDDTPHTVKQFGDSRIEFHRFTKNRGANAARNKGIELSNGKFISFLDSDDEFQPMYIEKVISKFLSCSQDCVGVYTSFDLIVDGEYAGTESAKDGYLTYDEILTGDVVGGFSYATFRSSVFEQVGHLDEMLQSSQDYDFFIRVLQEGYDICGINERLVCVYQESGTNRISDNLNRQLQGTQRILEKHQDELTPKGLARLYYYRAFGYAQDGDYANARQYFKRSIQAYPKKWLAYIHLSAAVHPITFNLLLDFKRLVRRYLY